MVNKRKASQIIDIIFWGIILISTIANIQESVNINIISIAFDEIAIKEYFITAVMIFGIIVFSFIISIIENYELTAIYIGMKIAMKKFYKDKLSKIDLKKYENYYRDIIQKYSPGVLDYIDDFKIGRNTLTAILMGLKLKGVINEDLKIIKSDFTELDENEKYVCSHINDLKNIEIEELKDGIIEDCKKYKLLEIKKQTQKHKEVPVVNRLIVGSIFPFIIIFIVFMIDANDIIKTIAIILPFLLAFFIRLRSVYRITYAVANSKEPYVRTKIGEQANEKLEGLKKYLEDFSSLENKSEEELMIWEDYLIYSVIFNQNEKIIKEYEEKLDRV